MTIRLRRLTNDEALDSRFQLVASVSSRDDYKNHGLIRRHDFPVVLEVMQPDGAWAPVPLAE